MADLEDYRQHPLVVDLCVARGGVLVALKQPMAREPLVFPVMGGRRRLDEFRLSDSFRTELEKYLLGANGDMDNKFPPSYSLEENWAVQADFPFVTMPSDGCSMGLQLAMVIPDLEHIFGITTDCKIGVSHIIVACFPHGFLQVLNRGMDGEQVLEVVQEFFGLPEEEETKLYSKYPAKIQLSSSLDVPLHWYVLEQIVLEWPSNPPSSNKKVNFKRGFNAMDMKLIEGHNFVSIFNGTILGDHPEIMSVASFVGEGRPLKASYNAEHGHPETIMHALGVQRALMLGAGTGSSSPNAAMVNLWLDSGASCHVIGNEEILSNRHDPPAGGRLLKVADGFEHKVESIGTIDTLGFRIPNVRFIRRFENLISAGQLAEDHNICSYLDKTSCKLILWVGQEPTLVGEGIKDKRNGLYRLTFLLVP